MPKILKLFHLCSIFLRVKLALLINIEKWTSKTFYLRSSAKLKIDSANKYQSANSYLYLFIGITTRD